VLVLLSSAASALAQPVVETSSVYSISRYSAVAEGSIRDAGAEASYFFEYDFAGSPWCSEGRWLQWLHVSTPGRLVHGRRVQATLPFLLSGDSYCVRLVVSEGDETYAGAKLVFTAGAPSVRSTFAETARTTSELVGGKVALAGVSGSYHVRYGTAGSEWCASHGSEGAAQETDAVQLIGEAAARGNAQTEVNGLENGAAYCAQLVVAGREGEVASGEIVSFTAGEPFAVAEEAYATGPETAVVEGLVAPEGASYHVDYSLHSSEWCESEGALGAPELQTDSSNAAGEAEAVAVTLAGLTPGQSYCAALAAQSGAQHTSASPSVDFTAGAPTVQQEGEPYSTGPTTAVIGGLLDPAGQTTTYMAAWAPADSEWCESEGEEGTAELASPAATLASTDGGFHTVSVTLTGLSEHEGFCAAIVAENAGGAARDAPLEAVTGTPSALALASQSLSPTATRVAGRVDGAGQQTEYELQYAEAESPFCSGEVAPGADPESGWQQLSGGEGEFVEVGIELAGLHAGTQYCAQLVARNPNGHSVEGVLRPSRIEFLAGAPAASTLPTVTTKPEAALVEGSVDPAGAATSYQVNYGLASSQWCRSGGTKGSAEHASAATPLEGEDGEQHVAVQLSGLTASTEYCAAVLATGPYGSAHGAVVRFKTASAPSKTQTQEGPPPPPGASSGSSTPSSQGGESGGGSTGETKTASSEPPKLGVQAGVGEITGTVQVRKPGTNEFVALSQSGTVPTGSELETTHGSLTVTVVLPNGATQSAQTTGGRFRLEQEASGFTRFVLTLALTGCPRTTLPRGTAASIFRTGPLTRHLAVKEHGGKWGTTGRFVSTSVEGTAWITTDECGRSVVHVTQGKVKVLNLVTHKSKVVKAGHSYEALAARKRKRKR